VLELLHGDPAWLRACYRPVEQMKSLHGEARHV
jgi:oligopeptide transport system ATP-binding protein